MSEEKISKFRAIVNQNPDDELAQFTLGQTLFDEGNFEEAKNHLAKALEIQTDWMLPAILLGKCWLELNQKDRAREVFEKALVLAEEQDHKDPAEELRGILEEMDAN